MTEWWIETARSHDEEYGPKATMSESHREWHHNSGVPMGTPGCPQDACHPIDDTYDTCPWCGGEIYDPSLAPSTALEAHVQECEPAMKEMGLI